MPIDDINPIQPGARSIPAAMLNGTLDVAKRADAHLREYQTPPRRQAGGGGILRPCTLSMTSGNNGAYGNAVTFVYTVTDAETAVQVGTGVAPLHRRLTVETAPGLVGMYWMDGVTVKLPWTDETALDVTGCAA